ncbi:hypothetical protein [Pseudohongiella acticola]|uniref:hypothetical protein n=1 Tax=Pseudohongiella acticola TaxID=1524254 RepID=UPI001113051A|nr:hypothetical protein [Pseudohongiella acticola]
MIGHRRSTTPLWEWFVGLAGFVLICFTIVYLAWLAATAGEQPPDIEFDVVSVEPVMQRYLVLVDVSNRGDQTASALQLESRLVRANEDTLSATSQVDYLAAESTRRVGFYFPANPATGELEFVPLGYQEP